MDKGIRLEELMQKMLSETPSPKNKRVRVVNLSVYDQSIDANELTRIFKFVTVNTSAQNAQLHVRRSEANSKDTTLAFPVTPVRVDSLELEEITSVKS